MKTAVIMPVYNTRPYLEQTIAALKNQSLADYEVFMVDDGSTDGSGEYLDLIAAQDKRFTALHKSNGGVSSARNLALSFLKRSGRRFDYLHFMDSDDLLSSNFYELMLKGAAAGEAVLACRNESFKDEGALDLNYSEEYKLEELSRENFIRAYFGAESFKQYQIGRFPYLCS